MILVNGANELEFHKIQSHGQNYAKNSHYI